MTLTDHSPASPLLPRPSWISAQHLPSLIVAIAIGVLIGLFVAAAQENNGQFPAGAPAAAAQPTPDWHGNVRSSAGG